MKYTLNPLAGIKGILSRMISGVRRIIRINVKSCNNNNNNNAPFQIITENYSKGKRTSC